MINLNKPEYIQHKEYIIKVSDISALRFILSSGKKEEWSVSSNEYEICKKKLINLLEPVDLGDL